MRSQILNIILFLWAVSEMQAQQPFFREFPVGIRSNNVGLNKIFEAKDGTLWFTASNGIYHFDGVNSSLFTLENNRTTYTAIYADNDIVFSGTSDGRLIQSRRNNILKSIQLSSSSLTSILPFQKKLLVGTMSEGLFILEDAKIIAQLSTENGLPDATIHDIVQINDFLYLATDGGLVKLRSDFTIEKIFTTADGLSDNLVYAINYFNDKVYLGMQNGTISIIDISTNTIEVNSKFNALNKRAIVKILVNKYDVFLFTEDATLFACDPELQVYYECDNNDNLLANKRGFVDAILDAEGNLIVTNFTHTPSIADTKFGVITTHENISFQNASFVYLDDQKRLWIATPQGLFQHENRFSDGASLTKYTKSPSSPDKSIISIAQSNENSIWFGMYGGGLGIIDIKQNKISYFNEKNILPDNNILSLSFDGHAMWLATLNGVVKAQFTNGKLEVTSIPQLDSFSKFIYCVHADSKGRLWCGTDGKGAAYFLNNTVYPVSSSKSIVDITEDSEGNIWLLNNLNEIEIFTKDGKLEQAKPLVISGNKLNILSIEKSIEGNIIALSTDGITELSAKFFIKKHFPSNVEINSNFLNIVSEDSDGNIWIALENALVKYSPQKQFQRQQPQIHFGQLLVNLVPTDTMHHSFSHDQNHFSFAFSSLWFKTQEPLNYKYYLEGFPTNQDYSNQQWTTTKDNFITFPNLPPGEYVMHIQASVSGSVFMDEFKYSFTIEKPFWQQWYFYFFLLILLILLIIGLSSFISSKREKKNQLEKQRLQIQLDTLINQINPHFLFNSFNTLIATITTDSESAVEYVEHLSDYYRKILQRQNQELISLHEELELVKDYLFLQKKRFGENLMVEFNLNANIEDIAIPPMTLQLLAENAVKHNVISKEKTLSISIELANDFIIVSNTKNIRSASSPGLGIGLNNINYRYKILFHREIEIEDTSDYFIVRLPINRKTIER